MIRPSSSPRPPSVQSVFCNAAPLLPPGSLLAMLAERRQQALACGALQGIETEQLVLDDGGVRFVVRVVSSLRHKTVTRGVRTRQAACATNPFLPPEAALTVGAISPGHLVVLNKFQVLDGHLLIITRCFEDQESLLTPADFRALCACLAEYPGLGFYNGGRLAGASQAHKHLQLVPLPLVAEGLGLPMAPLLAGAGPRCPALPFAHAFGRLSPAARTDPRAAAGEAHGLYRSLLARLGIVALPRAGREYPSLPYNLLVADDWMLVVPRIREDWQGISINALGFAGSLFVRDRAQLELIRAAGPLRLLQAVAGD